MVEITRNVLENGEVLVVTAMVTRGCIVVVKGCVANQLCRGGAGGVVMARTEGSLLVVEEEVVAVVEVEIVGLERCIASGGDVLVVPLGGGNVLKVGERMWLSPYRHVLRSCNPSCPPPRTSSSLPSSSGLPDDPKTWSYG